MDKQRREDQSRSRERKIRVAAETGRQSNANSKLENGEWNKKVDRTAVLTSALFFFPIAVCDFLCKVRCQWHLPVTSSR